MSGFSGLVLGLFNKISSILEVVLRGTVFMKCIPISDLRAVDS